MHSDTGSIRISLCGDTKAPFPGACVTYSGQRAANAFRATYASWFYAWRAVLPVTRSK